MECMLPVSYTHLDVYKRQQQSNSDAEEKLKLSRQKELEFLQKEQLLKTQEAELEITLQRKLQEERLTLSAQIQKLSLIHI